MRFDFISLAVLVLAVFNPGCKQQQAENPPAGVPQDFYEFYEKFHSDSLYQLEHIVFPLEGLPANNNVVEKLDSFLWTRSDWNLHKPFDDMDGTFQRQFVVMYHVVTEQITDASGSFQMKRRFSKIGNEWHLIYYEAMRKVQ